jgi:hypothetical protein
VFFFWVKFAKWWYPNGLFYPPYKIRRSNFYNFVIILTVWSKASHGFDWLGFGNRWCLNPKPLEVVNVYCQSRQSRPPIHLHRHSCFAFSSFVATLILLSMKQHRTLLYMTSFFIANILSFLSTSRLYMFIKRIITSLCFYFVVVSCHYIFLPPILIIRWHWNLEL